jgi:hypothetical protein
MRVYGDGRELIGRQGATNYAAFYKNYEKEQGSCFLVMGA